MKVCIQVPNAEKFPQFAAAFQSRTADLPIPEGKKERIPNEERFVKVFIGKDTAINISPFWLRRV